MAKIIPTRISESERKKLKRLLSAKIAKLKSQREVSDFLEDLLTESEFIMIIRRLEIAKMLLDGYLYYQIRNKLGASYETIRVVRNKINKGKGGYLNFIKKLKII